MKLLKLLLAEKIFTDDSEHKFCDSIIHPLVMDEIRALTENIDAVAEIPLLPEAGRPEWVDRAIYITAKFEARAERCAVQRGWSVDELRRRESLLLPQSVRMSVCERVIHNNNNIHELTRKLEEIL